MNYIKARKMINEELSNRMGRNLQERMSAIAEKIDVYKDALTSTQLDILGSYTINAASKEFCAKDRTARSKKAFETSVAKLGNSFTPEIDESKPLFTLRKYEEAKRAYATPKKQAPAKEDVISFNDKNIPYEPLFNLEEAEKLYKPEEPLFTVDKYEKAIAAKPAKSLELRVDDEGNILFSDVEPSLVEDESLFSYDNLDLSQKVPLYKKARSGLRSLGRFMKGFGKSLRSCGNVASQYSKKAGSSLLGYLRKAESKLKKYRNVALKYGRDSKSTALDNWTKIGAIVALGGIAAAAAACGGDKLRQLYPHLDDPRDAGNIVYKDAGVTNNPISLAAGELAKLVPEGDALKVDGAKIYGTKPMPEPDALPSTDAAISAAKLTPIEDVAPAGLEATMDRPLNPTEGQLVKAGMKAKAWENQPVVVPEPVAPVVDAAAPQTETPEPEAAPASRYQRAKEKVKKAGKWIKKAFVPSRVRVCEGANGRADGYLDLEENPVISAERIDVLCNQVAQVDQQIDDALQSQAQTVSVLPTGENAQGVRNNMPQPPVIEELESRFNAKSTSSDEFRARTRDPENPFNNAMDQFDREIDNSWTPKPPKFIRW